MIWSLFLETTACDPGYNNDLTNLRCTSIAPNLGLFHLSLQLSPLHLAHRRATMDNLGKLRAVDRHFRNQ